MAPQNHVAEVKKNIICEKDPHNQKGLGFSSHDAVPAALSSETEIKLASYVNMVYSASKLQLHLELDLICEHRVAHLVLGLHNTV